MDVRAPDDELPGGLAFTEVDLEEPEPPAHPALRRALSWVVVLALLAGGAFVGLRWYGDRDVRAVLTTTSALYRTALSDLADARDPVALATAAGEGRDRADRLDGQLGRLSSTGGGRRAAVARQVRAESAVLRALVPLERLADAPLGVWGRTRADVERAVTVETAARTALRGVDSGAAQRLPDVRATLARVAATVGQALVQDVQRSAGELLDDLAAAERTPDLRAAAERATAQREAVAAAAAGLGPTGDAAVLEEFSAALDAVRLLATLTPAETTAWSDARARLGVRLLAVAQADDGLAAGSVRARLPLVLASVDRVVARAAAAQAAWQPLRDAAVAQQAGDRAALARYAEGVRAASSEWAAVRTDVATALSTRAAEPRATVRLALLPQVSAADRLVTGMRAPPPAGTEQAHAALLATVEPLAAALAASLVELGADPCQDCPVSGAPVWPALDEGVRAAAAWDDRLPAWEAAVAAADAAIAARALPPPPDA